MKLDKNYKIEAAASAESTRVEITDPYLEITRPAQGEDPGEGVIVASDGHMLVSLPVLTGPGDEAGYVPGAALAAARKLTRTMVDVECNGSVKLSNGTSYLRGHVGETYPKWRNACATPENDVVSISFNAELLGKMCKAMGTSKVVLRFERDSLEAILVKPAGNEGEGVGYLMPMRLT